MPKHDRLFYLLSELSDEQITSIRVNPLEIRKDSNDLWSKDYQIQKISQALRSAAGNSIMNVGRDRHDFPWKQVVIDVADKLSNGHTPLSWTSYSLNDKTPVEQIELDVLRLFEERARQWWEKLSASQKDRFVARLNKNIAGFKPAELDTVLKGMHRTEFWSVRAIDWIISKGLILGLEAVPASGLFGFIGGTFLSSLGWFLVTHTLGYMFGVKLLVTGLAAGHLFRSMIIVGGLSVGTATTIPMLLWSFAEPNYRKTIPVTLLLLTNEHLTKNLAVTA